MKRNHNLSWSRFIFAQSFSPAIDPTTVYQSPDFPHVFLGSADKDDLRRVKEITGDDVCIRINLSGEHAEGAIQRESPVAPPFMNVPLPDEPELESPGEQDSWQKVFNQTVDQVANIIQENRCPIYIHCYAGINRSVATLVAALSKLTNKTFSTVLKEMRTIRPMAWPNDIYRSWGEEATRNIDRAVA